MQLLLKSISTNVKCPFYLSNVKTKGQNFLFFAFSMSRSLNKVKRGRFPLPFSAIFIRYLSFDLLVLYVHTIRIMYYFYRPLLYN